MNKTVIKNCPKHGETEFAEREKGSRFRCRKCQTEAVLKRRKKVKEKLVEDFGGQCSRCGYNKCIAALEFHHLDSTTKKFGLAQRGLTKSYKRLLEEAKKCILVCSNCHREIENLE